MLISFSGTPMWLSIIHFDEVWDTSFTIYYRFWERFLFAYHAIVSMKKVVKALASRDAMLKQVKQSNTKRTSICWLEESREPRTSLGSAVQETFSLHGRVLVVRIMESTAAADLRSEISHTAPSARVAGRVSSSHCFASSCWHGRFLVWCPSKTFLRLLTNASASSGEP